MPTHTATVTIAEADDATTVTIVSSFVNLEEMERMLETGMDKGMAAAFGQVDALLEATRTPPRRGKAAGGPPQGNRIGL
jgi:uncharacterized protein YndB with AHSA1/START domain